MKSYIGSGPADESALDPNSSYAKILGMIEGAPRVVDFGCGQGNLARLLSQRGCTVVGVDINEDHAVLAREYCSEVLVADIERASLLSLFPSDRFDVAIFADILEHLRNPESLLKEVSRILRPGGYVLASIPNIAHGAIRLSMMEGRFEYQELGILDDTHVRFFTRATVMEAFEKSGLLVESVETTTAPIFEPTGTLVPVVDRDAFSDQLVAAVESDPDAHVLQFVLRAIPTAASDVRQKALRQHNEELQARLRSMELEIDRLQREADDKAAIPSAEHYEDVLSRLHLVTAECEELHTQNCDLTADLDESKALVEMFEEEARDLANRLAQSEARAENAEKLRLQSEALEAQLRDLHVQFEALAADRSAHALRADIALEQVERIARDVARLQPEAERAAELAEERDRLARVAANLSAEVDRLRELDVRTDAQAFEMLRLQQALDSADQRLNISQASGRALAADLQALRDSHLQLRQRCSQHTERVSQLVARVDELSIQLADAEGRAAARSAELAHLTSKVDLYEHVIRAMRQSKFWTVRNAWFKLKRMAGIETDIW